jgi:hypothetical protein
MTNLIYNQKLIVITGMKEMKNIKER